jgi:hypothetical protein
MTLIINNLSNKLDALTSKINYFEQSLTKMDSQLFSNHQYYDYTNVYPKFPMANMPPFNNDDGVGMSGKSPYNAHSENSSLSITNEQTMRAGRVNESNDLKASNELTESEKNMISTIAAFNVLNSLSKHNKDNGDDKEKENEKNDVSDKTPTADKSLFHPVNPFSLILGNMLLNPLNNTIMNDKSDKMDDEHTSKNKQEKITHKSIRTSRIEKNKKDVKKNDKKNDKDSKNKDTNKTHVFELPIFEMLFGGKNGKKNKNDTSNDEGDEDDNDIFEEIKLPDESKPLRKNAIEVIDDKFVEIDFKNLKDIVNCGQQFIKMIDDHNEKIKSSASNKRNSNDDNKTSDKENVKKNKVSENKESDNKASENKSLQSINTPSIQMHIIPLNNTNQNNNMHVSTDLLKLLLDASMNNMMNKSNVDDVNMNDPENESNYDEMENEITDNTDNTDNTINTGETYSPSNRSDNSFDTNGTNSYNSPNDSYNMDDEMNDNNKDNVRKHYEDEIEKDENGLYMFFGKKYSVDPRKMMRLVRPIRILNSMIGMKVVKNQCYRFISHFLQSNDDDENGMKNVRIHGGPGIGKTELGKILCMIYSALEIVPSKRFTIVKATELMGKYVGETRQKTKAVLDKARGGVLFIDEVYSLMSGSGDKYSFGKECIDTINQELSENRRNLVVIVAGYEEEVNEAFFSVNKGLDRRFPFSFTLNKYTKEELRDIFFRMLRLCNNKYIDLNVTDDDILKLFQNDEYFDNCGGDIENLLTQIALTNSNRTLGKHPSLKGIYTLNDINEGFESFVANKKNNKNKSDEKWKHHLYS